MYGLPKNVDLAFLKGKELLQVCLGENEVIMNFFEATSITIQTTIYHYEEDRLVGVFGNAPASAATVVRFLGHTIADFQTSEDGTLRLKFSNGESLEIRDEDKHYECYLIGHQGKMVVV